MRSHKFSSAVEWKNICFLVQTVPLISNFVPPKKFKPNKQHSLQVLQQVLHVALDQVAPEVTGPCHFGVDTLLLHVEF